MENSVFNYNSHAICYYIAKQVKTEKHYTKKRGRICAINAGIGFFLFLTVVGFIPAIILVWRWVNVSTARKGPYCREQGKKVKMGMPINQVRAIMYGIHVKREGLLENGRYLLDYYQTTGHDDQFEEKIFYFDSTGKLVDEDQAFHRITVTTY